MLFTTEKSIENGIKEVMRRLNLDRMPTSKEVRQNKIPGLENAILNTGGYVKWGEKLQLAPKVKNTKWNSELIKEKILNIANVLGLERMPSRSEIMTVEQTCSLHDAIIHSGGYWNWAKTLQLDIKDSETKTGKRYEEIAIDILNKKGYKAEQMTMKSPYDILINDHIRVDVKAGKAYYLRGSRVHSFGINKKFPTCDLYIVFAIDENENIERAFIIPSEHLKVVSLCIGKESKYNKFIDRWDYIEKYNEFYQKLSS